MAVQSRAPQGVAVVQSVQAVGCCCLVGPGNQCKECAVVDAGNGGFRSVHLTPLCVAEQERNDRFMASDSLPELRNDDGIQADMHLLSTG